MLLDGLTVQVRYVANVAKPSGGWVNEHCVKAIGVDLYALVIFEAFVVVGVLVFPTNRLESICRELGKHHPRQAEELQLTRSNWWTIRDNPERFRNLGMRVSSNPPPD